MKHWPYLFLALAAGLALRTVPPWNAVFGGQVIFLESDPWYYDRLTENLLANFPDRLWFDPFTYYPYGTYTHYGPFLVYLGALMAKLAGAGDPESIKSILAFVPVLGGALLAIPVYFFAREIFGRSAGAIAACLVLLMPGQLLARSTLGFNDHHIWEAVWVTSFFALFAAALARPGGRGLLLALSAGVALGLYILTWAPGFTAVLVVLCFFFLSYSLKSHLRVPTKILVRTGAAAFGVAALLYLPVAFKYPGLSLLHYSPLQLVMLLASLGVSLLFHGFDALDRKGLFHVLGPRRAWVFPLVMLMAATVVLGILPRLFPVFDFAARGLLSAVTSGGGPQTIQEVAPLFESPAGGFSLAPAWRQFSITFYFALAGMVYVLVRCFRERKYLFLLPIVWGVLMLAAVAGQNRFAYAFAVVSAIFAGAMADFLLRALGSRTPGPRPAMGAGRFAAGVFLLALLFVPTAVGAYMQSRSASVGSMDRRWYETLSWMRENTPGKDVHEKLYFARSAAPDVWGDPYPYPEGTYGVMSWWDAGNWIAAVAHRIPHANPFQQGIGSRAEASVARAEPGEEASGASPFRQGVGGEEGRLGAAPFFTAWNEDDANVIAEQLGTGFVVTDVEMATVKFYAIATWAEGTLERFADVYGRGSGYVTFTRTPDGRTGISFTRMPPPAKPEVTSTLETPNDNYYRTMAARFHIFDGYGLARYRMVYESEPEASGITRESLYRMAYNSLYAPMMDMPEVGTAPTGYVKVFEKVKGAVIRGRADGAGEVSIACTVETNRGRRFEYGQRVKVENGSFELVVPYAQDTTYPVKPMTPYFLRAGDATREIELADEDLDGRIVTLDLSGGRLHK